MTLGCARCGNCCEDICIDRQHADTALKWWLYWQGGGKVNTRTKKSFWRTIRFVAEHWTEVRRLDDTDQVIMKCDRFDSVARTCMAHDDRPPVCSEYPWYGVDKEPDGEIRKLAMHARAQHVDRRCSFLLDLPPSARPADARPLIPLTVLGR